LTHRSDDCFIASNQIVKDLRNRPRDPSKADRLRGLESRIGAGRRIAPQLGPHQKLLGTKRTTSETTKEELNLPLQSSVAISQSSKPHPTWQEAFEDFVSIAPTASIRLASD
jgi:hypothetical protein